MALSCKEKAIRSHTVEKAFGNGRSARAGAKHTQRPSLSRWIGRFITMSGDIRKITSSSSMMCPAGHVTTSHQLRSIRHAHPYYPDRDGSHHPELEPWQGIRRYPQAHYAARPLVNGAAANLHLDRCAPSPEDKRKVVLMLTPRARKDARRVAEIESALYAMLSAVITDQQIEAVLPYQWNVVTGRLRRLPLSSQEDTDAHNRSSHTDPSSYA